MASDGGDESTGEPHSVFQTRRLLQVIELPLENSDETNVILAFASRCAAKKQFQAFYCADKTLLLRSLEEDLHPRYWRLPWAMALERLQPTSKLPTTIDGSSTTPLQQQHHVVGLEFAPEGDWLAVIVSSGLRTFLLLVPVASLVTRERKVSLQMHLRDGTPEDLMSVAPSAMSTKMLSFLRPHGQNGAKYNSAVTGDSEDMSVLEFAQGMSSPTCVTWWRSFNGRNYVLLGSSSDLISIVHVETNVECCRCELSGKIVRMELVRTATTTTLLVETTKQHPDGATSWFFQVLLEMRKDHAMITTFPDHFLQDTASFRPVRIKHFGAAASVHVVHRATDDDDKEEDLLAVCDGRSVRLYSNDFTWSLLRTLTLPPSVLEADGNPPPPQVGKIALCSSQLFLVQVARKTHNVALWVSIQRRPRPTSPSSAVLSGDDDDDRGQDDVETQVVHTLKLREDEWVRHAQLGHASSKDQPSTIAYFVHTDHQVYECRPKWTSSTLFHALYTRTMHVQHAVFIGYALGLDMAALCESVADAICADHTNKKMSRNSCEWVMRLYAKSGHVMPSTTLQNLLQNGGVNAIEYAKEALALPSPSYKHDRQFVAHAVITSALKLHHRATCPATKDWAWFLWFLQSNADFDTVFAIARCVDFECVDAALLIGHARHHVDAALHALQHVGMTLSEAQVDTLLSQHHASNLTAPEARVLFRSLPLSVQLKVLLKHPSAIWAQRDWLVRVLPDATDAECVALASTLDPRTLDSVQFQSSDGGLLPYNNGVPASLSDVASSEAIPVTLEERVELFLTLLLRLNCTSLDTPPSKVPTAFSQQDLVQLLGGWSKQYRPPVMVFRCAEYGNWAAAAACYEAQGEWVDAIECKLHLHDIEPSSSLSNPQAHHVMKTHEELVGLLESLVFSSVMAPPMRVSVLARLLVHWHAMRYDIEVLERHISQQSDITPVAMLLFTSPDSFDIRDRGWVSQCQTTLPFSGRFYFDICHRHIRLSSAKSVQETTPPAADHPPSPPHEPPFHIPSPTVDPSILDTVLENIHRQHTDLRHVAISRQTPAALGSTDPIETHAVVFSCGHAFPARVFQDDVVPLFEKKMATDFPSVPRTAATLVAEYQRSKTMEAPCPVCAFSRVQRVLASHATLHPQKVTREPPRPRIMTSDQWVWK